jgi:integrase
VCSAAEAGSARGGHAGGPVRYTNFRVRVFNPAVKNAGLDGVTFHALRHSAGGLLRQAGVHTQIIQQRLGQASSRTTTDIYGWAPGESEKAAATSLNDIFTTRGLNAACDEVGEASA